MRQTELNLSEEDRSTIEAIRSKGVHQAREVNRAHVLACLDRDIPESQIMAVLEIGRTAVWRARAAYRQGGLELAVFDVQRSGRPRQYGNELDLQHARYASPHRLDTFAGPDTRPSLRRGTRQRSLGDGGTRSARCQQLVNCSAGCQLDLCLGQWGLLS